MQSTHSQRLGVTTNDRWRSLSRVHQSSYRLSGCGAALAATLPEPYRTLEVQSWRADLVFAGAGLRPNSRKNRSGLLPSFQEASRAA
eukprot:3046187-Prymnesium_polylepis.2